MKGEAEMEVDEENQPKEMSYDDKVARASIIAKPMASKKLAKKVYKLIKKAKAAKQKNHFWSGLKLVQTRIRKGDKGVAVFAGNVSPVDVIAHLPAVCEDKKIPYVFVPTGKDLGTAMGVKRCTIVILIKSHADYQEVYDECVTEIKKLPDPIPIE